MKYIYQTTKARALYESTDGPPGQPTGNLPYSDGSGDVHREVCEFSVRVYWRPELRIWPQFGSNQDPNP